MSTPRTVKLYRSPPGKPIGTLRGPRSMEFDAWLVARGEAKRLARAGASVERIITATGLTLDKPKLHNHAEKAVR